MDLFCKFIIEDDALIIGKVTFHKELAIDIKKVKGGGDYVLNHKDKKITFFGESYDFGPATIEDIQKAVTNEKVYSNPYSEHDLSKEYKCLYQDVCGDITELN